MTRQEYMSIIQQILDKIPEYKYTTAQYKQYMKYSDKTLRDNKWVRQ